MPITNDSSIAPKSVLRHRPIGERTDPQGRDEKAHPLTPTVPRASRPRVTESDAVAEWQRVRETAETEQKPTAHDAFPVRRTPAHPTTLTRAPRTKGASAKDPSARLHPLVYLGLGMVAMLVLWMLLSALLGWVSIKANDLRYGYPRTFQTDQVVGHADSAANPSHFLALNLRGHIEVIELPGGDASHARIFLGPQLFGAGSNLVPVTLTFVDVNRDQKPDMIIHLQATGSSATSDPESLMFINTGMTFRPPTQAELPRVEQFLQHLRQ